MAGSNKNKKRKNMVYGIEDNQQEQVDELMSETGMKKSEIGRRSLAAYLENKANDPAIMMHLINLIHMLNDAEKYIPKETYEDLQYCINNIMVLKGGDSYAEN
jgi:hypothetical protein